MGMSAAHCQGNVREFQSVWRVVTLTLLEHEPEAVVIVDTSVVVVLVRGDWFRQNIRCLLKQCYWRPPNSSKHSVTLADQCMLLLMITLLLILLLC